MSSTSSSLLLSQITEKTQISQVEYLWASTGQVLVRQIIPESSEEIRDFRSLPLEVKEKLKLEVEVKFNSFSATEKKHLINKWKNQLLEISLLLPASMQEAILNNQEEGEI